MDNILSFVEVSNIAGVYIKMDTYKGKVINFHIKDSKIIYFKACTEGILCTNINYPTMINNPVNN